MKVVICDSSVVDAHGTRIMIEGIRLDRFRKNPIVLFMHEGNSLPIGRLENIRIEGTQLVGELITDDSDPDTEAQRIIHKIKNGFLNGFSVMGNSLSESKDPAHMLPGQASVTILELDLYEVSVAILPSNENAVTIQRSVHNYLAINPHLKKHTMSKEIRRKLGLPEDATDADVEAAIDKLQGTNPNPGTAPTETTEPILRVLEKLSEKVDKLAEVGQLTQQITRSGKKEEKESGLPIGVRVSRYLNKQND